MIISFMFTVSSKIHLKTRHSSFKEHAKFLSTFPSKEALITKGVPMESTLCCWCGTQAENADHILNRGLLARYAWWQIWVWLRTSVPNLVSPREVQEFVKS